MQAVQRGASGVFSLSSFGKGLATSVDRLDTFSPTLYKDTIDARSVGWGGFPCLFNSNVAFVVLTLPVLPFLLINVSMGLIKSALRWLLSQGMGALYSILFPLWRFRSGTILCHSRRQWMQMAMASTWKFNRLRLFDTGTSI